MAVEYLSYHILIFHLSVSFHYIIKIFLFLCESISTSSEQCAVLTREFYNK
jgi:hypothetical protein